MMNLASIETIKGIRPHPSADKLEFATVLGYDCLVPVGRFVPGQRVVMIQPDTVLPDEPWSQTYLKFCKTRVKAIRLRGEWSFGIVEALETFPSLSPDASPAVVAETLGVFKYEAPAPQEPDSIGFLPFQIPKTDEDRWQNIEQLPFGSRVDVTQKIDGQSCSFYCVKEQGEWQFGVLGRTLEYRADAFNNYTRHMAALGIETKLRDYCMRHDVSLCLRGESYGPGIQSCKLNPHSKASSGWALFGVWLIHERRYARKGDPYYFLNVARELELPHVLVLEESVSLSEELIRRYDSEQTEVNGAAFEGIVINTAEQSFKVINKHYDAQK